MNKKCGVCQELLKDDDLVVSLMLAKLKLKPESYDLQYMGQTILSHLYCAENKPVVPSVTEVKA